MIQNKLSILQLLIFFFFFFFFFIGQNINNATHYKKTLNKMLLIALNMLTLQGYMSSNRILALFFWDEFMDLFKQSVKNTPTSIQFFSIFTFRLDMKLFLTFSL